MVTAAPPAVVQAPVLAAAPPLSLVAAARTPTLGAGVRWEAGGVTYAPENCADHGTLDPCSNNNFGSAQPSNLAAVTARPFGIWASDECSTFGFLARDWEGRALRQLEAATPWEVEREFWAGNLSGAVGTEESGNRFLADAAHVTDISGGAAVSVLDGIACLEEALGSTGHGGQGMIHLSRKAMVALSGSSFDVHRVGNVLMTPMDTVLVPGVGYPGTAPALAPPGNLVATPGTNAGSSMASGTYQYVVTAIDAAGETTASAPATATVTGPTGQVVLTWTAVPSATGYRVFRLVSGAYRLFGTPATATFTDTGAASINANTPPALNTTGALAEGAHYIYATDYVTVLLGDPVTRMAGEQGLATEYGVLDPSVNTLRYRAERLAAVAFDGCRHFGIRVNVASCGGSI